MLRLCGIVLWTILLRSARHGLGAEFADDCGDFILLEEADGGDAGGSGFEAGVGVMNSDASECEDEGWSAAGFPKSVQASRILLRRIFFFEHRGKDSEGGLVRGGCDDFLGGVTGDGDHRIW